MPKRIRAHLSALDVATSRLEVFANHMPAMLGYWNRQLRCEFANAAYVEWFGKSPQDVIGMSMLELQGESLFRLNEPHARLALAGHEQRFEREIPKPDGTIGYTDARYMPDTDEYGKVVGFFVLVSDITELHQAYRRVRELALRLESAREEERLAIAQTLHEGIAQDLFAMKLGLDQLQAQATGRVGVMHACKELTEAITKCMDDTRQIANGLRPAALAHMQVSVAIKEHARFFSDLAKLNIRVTEVAPLPELDENRRLLLFRTTQEALTNIARHSNASTVEIMLYTDPTHIVLDVIDNGGGLAKCALEKPGSLGLLGLRERVKEVGGRVSVTNNSDGGATLSARIPFPDSTNGRRRRGKQTSGKPTFARGN